MKSSRILGLNKTVDMRIKLLRVVLCCLFFGGILRAAYLQLWEGSELRAEAFKDGKKYVKVPGMRGTIYDRNLEKLAVSLEVESIYASPKAIKDKPAVAATLARILGRPAGEFLAQLNNKENSNFVWIARQVMPETTKRLREEKIHGINYLKESKRFYPNLRLASHIVGFVGLDNKGLEGLELKYEHYLEGHTGKIITPRDGRGRVLLANVTSVAPSSDGNDFILTLDKEIQFIAERELEKGVMSSGAQWGIAVVMDPKTGEILAMANRPGFDPNAFGDFSKDQIRNRAIADAFDPGSLFKVFLMGGVLDAGVAKLDDKIFCENGAFKVSSRVVHDFHPYGWLNVGEVLQKSSNIGCLKLGMALGAERFYHYITAFGFGSPTGVELPGEMAGLLNNYKSWRVLDLANISFGQGISITALQAAGAMSAIANEGKLMRPHIIRRVMDSRGGIMTEVKPTLVRKVMTPEAAHNLTQAMCSVVAPGGTGLKAAVPGYTVAGKTGTAQIYDPNKGTFSEDDYNAVFGGFLPAENPALVIFVVVNCPQTSNFGGEIAAPIFREIARQSLAHLDIKPAKEPQLWLTQYLNSLETVKTETPVSEGTAAPTPITTTPPIISANALPDFQGLSMREVLRTASKLPVTLNLEGSGLAVMQDPAPGTDMTQVKKCVVYFQPPG